MAKDEHGPQHLNPVVKWGGAFFVFLLAFFTFLAVVLAIANVFGPAVR